MDIKNFDDLMKYLEGFETDKEKQNDLLKNAMNYIKLCDGNNVLTFIDKISSSNMALNMLRYNLYIIYQDFGIKPILKITENLPFEQRYSEIYSACTRYNPSGYSIKDFFSDLLASYEKDYIEKNMESIIASSDIKTLLEENIIKDLSRMYPEKMKSLFPNIVAKMANIPIETINKDLLESLTEIVKQVSLDEGKDLSELEYVDKGSTSVVYKLGSKVIKFGTPRNTDKIPYHRRILQPLLRRNLEFGERSVYVEVAEYIYLDPDITQDEVYQIYKELRQAGILWLDCKKENVGRLIKDNSVHFSEPIYPRNETVGYIKDTVKKDSPMPKGELVILDTDLLLRKEDLKRTKLSHINTRFFTEFEKRYKEEQEEDREER